MLGVETNDGSGVAALGRLALFSGSCWHACTTASQPQLDRTMGFGLWVSGLGWFLFMGIMSFNDHTGPGYMSHNLNPLNPGLDRGLCRDYYTRGK